MASNGSNPRPDQDVTEQTRLPGPDGAPPISVDPQGIGSASRSCLVILTLLVALVLILCVSGVVRLLIQ